MSDKHTLSEQIYTSLKKDIITQKIPMGQKLTLQVLKDRFQVSHTPIREALTRLNEDGLVTYYSNRGVTITTFTQQDVRELYQFLGELDALAIQFCRLAYSQDLLLYELKETLLIPGSEGEADERLLKKERSDRFHYIFYKYANNNYLNEAAQKLRARIEVISNRYYTSANIESIEANHLSIYKAVEKQDYDLAADLMRKHMQCDLFMALKLFEQSPEE